MSSSELQFFIIMLRGRLDRAAKAERGASAVEWVVITAILVVIVGVVGVILRSKIQDKASSINLDTEFIV